MGAAKADQPYLMAFVEDKNDYNIVQDVIKSLNIANYEIIKGGIKEAIDIFKLQRSPQYLIVDVSKSDLPATDVTRLFEVCEPGMLMLAVGIRNDVPLYRDLIKLGVHEYVIKPLFSEILVRTLKNMLFGEEKGKESQIKKGKIISVIGSRGGVGNTFLATNLATILSHEKSRRVAAVDLDLHYGALALYFDKTAAYGLREILEDPERIDQVFLERVLTPVNTRLFILGSEEPLEERIQPKVEGVNTLLDYLSQQFHYVVVDLPHHMNTLTKTVIESSSVIILVCDPSVGSLRDTGRIMSLVGLEGSVRRIITVLNKVGAYATGEISPSDFEETLKHKISHVIPFDNVLPMACINKGEFIEEKENSLGIVLRDIVDDILGIQKSEEPESGLDRFFKKIKLR